MSTHHFATIRRLVLGYCLLAAGWLIVIPGPAVAADYVPGTPYTYVFDTNAASSEPLAPAALAAKTGWTALAEDDLKHNFQGDAVILNDKLAVVLRGRRSGAEVYAHTPAGWKSRARLASLSPAGDPAAAMTAITVGENTPASVKLAAVFKTAAGGRLALSYGITTGQRIVEIRPGEGTGRVLVSAGIRYVVVPDLFADDMVFGPGAFNYQRLELPTENMVLNLLEGSDAMLMCLWRSGRQGAAAVFSSADLRQQSIVGCEVQCGKDASLWVALIEGPGIWREQTFPADQTKKEMTLDWKAPFAARWRADFVRRNGAARSYDLAGPGQADEASASLAQGDCPCRFEGDRAKVNGDRPAWPLLIYPLDRTRATPLTAFCPVDMLRNTLGVGPCQYILQTEGLATETNPTPDQVMSFVEKQFEKKKEKKEAAQIKELLAQMVDNVAHAQARIEQYAAFARQVRALCAVEKPRADMSEGTFRSEAVDAMDQLAAEMDGSIAATRGTAEPKERAGRLAEHVAALIGKENSLAECQRLGAELRGIGAAQDRALSKCRMSARWLRQQAAAGFGTDRLAREVQARAEKVLQGK